MKLGLGTAQFGLDYGISNTQGQVNFSEIVDILNFARANEIKVIDTAQLYGVSEVALGNAGVSGFQVITKISYQSKLEDSLTNLKLNNLYAVLAHDADELSQNAEFWEKLVGYKKKGLVEKIGISVYTEEQLDLALEKYPVDIVQLPLNVFDQRFLQHGYLQKLKDLNVEIHARSVFLQGLLLMEREEIPGKFSEFSDHFALFESFLRNNRVSKLEAVLAFENTVECLDHFIIGVVSKKQLLDIYNSLVSLNKSYDFSSLSINDLKLISPANW